MRTLVISEKLSVAIIATLLLLVISFVEPSHIVGAQLPAVRGGGQPGYGDVEGFLFIVFAGYEASQQETGTQRDRKSVV